MSFEWLGENDASFKIYRKKIRRIMRIMAAEKKPKKIWDNCENIGEVHKSASTKIVVDLTARDGVKYVNIREWYKRKKDNVWKPGMHGIAVPIKVPIDGNVTEVLSNLQEAIKIAVQDSESFELENDEKAVWMQPKK